MIDLRFFDLQSPFANLLSLRTAATNFEIVIIFNYATIALPQEFSEMKAFSLEEALVSLTVRQDDLGQFGECCFNDSR